MNLKLTNTMMMEQKRKYNILVCMLLFSILISCQIDKGKANTKVLIQGKEDLGGHGSYKEPETNDNLTKKMIVRLIYYVLMKL